MNSEARKSTPEEIRERFDRQVERFTNLETGQTATVDAPLVLNLLTEAAARVAPKDAAVLDIGCGAGNFSLRLFQKLPYSNLTLVDLSQGMLDRAQERLNEAGVSHIRSIQGDVREVALGEKQFDVILASQVFHHLREGEEWEAVFSKVHRSLRPGGWLWISDLIEHDHPKIRELFWERYGEYLTGLGGEEYRREVFDYIEEEDTPRSLTFQIGLLRRTGFTDIEVLHKNGCFAAFGGFKVLV